MGGEHTFFLLPVMGEGHPYLIEPSPWCLLRGHTSPAFYDYCQMIQLFSTLSCACVASFCSSGCPGTHSVVLTDLALTAILVPQPSKHWDGGHEPAGLTVTLIDCRQVTMVILVNMALHLIVISALE